MNDTYYMAGYWQGNRNVNEIDSRNIFDFLESTGRIDPLFRQWFFKTRLANDPASLVTAASLESMLSKKIEIDGEKGITLGFWSKLENNEAITASISLSLGYAENSLVINLPNLDYGDHPNDLITTPKMFELLACLLQSWDVDNALVTSRQIRDNFYGKYPNLSTLIGWLSVMRIERIMLDKLPDFVEIKKLGKMKSVIIAHSERLTSDNSSHIEIMSKLFESMMN